MVAERQARPQTFAPTHSQPDPTHWPREDLEGVKRRKAEGRRDKEKVKAKKVQEEEQLNFSHLLEAVRKH